jgi:hypothetical protein
MTNNKGIETMSNKLEFTACERDLNATLTLLADNAAQLLKTMDHGTPQFYQVRSMACAIDAMLDRLQYV